MSWNAAFKILEPLAEWPSIRRAKIQELYELGSRVAEGCIVELGTFRGLGAIALALGARDGFGAPVFTVDDRIAKRGWAGEPYSSEDAQDLEKNLKRTGVAVKAVVGDCQTVAASWTKPVGLVVWDLGLHGRLLEDFFAWDRHLVSTGLFAIKDIDPPGFGQEGMARLEHWELDHECAAGFVSVYRRRLLDREPQPPS